MSAQAQRAARPGRQRHVADPDAAILPQRHRGGRGQADAHLPPRHVQRSEVHRAVRAHRIDPGAGVEPGVEGGDLGLEVQRVERALGLHRAIDRRSGGGQPVQPQVGLHRLYAAGIRDTPGLQVQTAGKRYAGDAGERREVAGLQLHLPVEEQLRDVEVAAAVQAQWAEDCGQALDAQDLLVQLGGRVEAQRLPIQPAAQLRGAGRRGKPGEIGVKLEVLQLVALRDQLGAVHLRLHGGGGEGAADMQVRLHPPAHRLPRGLGIGEADLRRQVQRVLVGAGGGGAQPRAGQLQMLDPLQVAAQGQHGLLAEQARGRFRQARVAHHQLRIHRRVLLRAGDGAVQFQRTPADAGRQQLAQRLRIAHARLDREVERVAVTPRGLQVQPGARHGQVLDALAIALQVHPDGIAHQGRRRLRDARLAHHALGLDGRGAGGAGDMGVQLDAVPAQPLRQQAAQRLGIAERRLEGQIAVVADIAAALHPAGRGGNEEAVQPQAGTLGAQVHGEVAAGHGGRQQAGGLDIALGHEAEPARGRQRQRAIRLRLQRVADGGAERQGGAFGRAVQGDPGAAGSGGQAEQPGHHAARGLVIADVQLHLLPGGQGDIGIQRAGHVEAPGLHAQEGAVIAQPPARLQVQRRRHPGHRLADLQTLHLQRLQRQPDRELGQGRDQAAALAGLRLRRRGGAFRQALEIQAARIEAADADLPAQQGAEIHIQHGILDGQVGAPGIGHGDPVDARPEGQPAMQPLDGQAGHVLPRQPGDHRLPGGGIGEDQHAADHDDGEEDQDQQQDAGPFQRAPHQKACPMPI